MASGVKVTEECITTYNNMYKDKKIRYAVFVISNGEIAVETVKDKEGSYDEFLEDLYKMDGNDEDCRYGLFDYEYTFNPQGAENIKKSKIFLILWAPENAKVKKKMLYSSSFDALKKAFVGVAKYIQANDKSDCEQQAVEDVLRATDRN